MFLSPDPCSPCSRRPEASASPTCWNPAQPPGPAPQRDDAKLGAQCVGGTGLASASAGGAAACTRVGTHRLSGLPGLGSARTPEALPPKVPASPPSLSPAITPQGQGDSGDVIPGEPGSMQWDTQWVPRAPFHHRSIEHLLCARSPETRHAVSF